MMFVQLAVGQKCVPQKNGVYKRKYVPKNCGPTGFAWGFSLDLWPVIVVFVVILDVYRGLFCEVCVFAPGIREGKKLAFEAGPKPNSRPPGNTTPPKVSNWWFQAFPRNKMHSLQSTGDILTSFLKRACSL